MQIWVIGAGKMAQDYMKILKALRVDFAYLSRTDKNLNAPWLSLEEAKNCPLPRFVIIATPIETLVDVALAFPAKRILLEKPGGLNVKDISRLQKLKCSTVSIGYNRRFLASVIEAKRRIAQSQLLSFHFEFNENAPQVEQLTTPAFVKNNWLLANSSHVVDLAFYLGGLPKNINAHQEGRLEWHQRGVYFSGMGETQSGARFTYASDWRSAGRWGIELCLPHERLILKPLEGLLSMPKGQYSQVPVALNLSDDEGFKPGLMKQTLAFLNEEQGVLPHLEAHLEFLKTALNPISGY